MKNKKNTKEVILLSLVRIIFFLIIPILLIFGMYAFLAVLINHCEQNKLSLIFIFFAYCFIAIWMVPRVFIIGKKICDKLLLVPQNSFSVLANGNVTIIKYANKHEFLIRKSMIDITKRDFESDKKGRKVSYIDKERIFSNFYSYKKNKINESSIKETIITNKGLLRELLENSSDIRKATPQEIGTLDKRIIGNRKLLLLSLIAFVPSIFGGPRLSMDFYTTIFLFILCLILIIIMLIGKGCRLLKIRNGSYHIMECNICDKKKYTRRGYGRRHFRCHYYKIRCRDKRMRYIDNWFECEYNTYEKKEKTNILLVLKGKKVYINSYDKMWISKPKIVKL